MYELNQFTVNVEFLSDTLIQFKIGEGWPTSELSAEITAMCDNELNSLVIQLRQRHNEVCKARPRLRARDRAELKVLGEIISFLEQKIRSEDGRNRH